MSPRLPIFPLDLVLFPGATVPLHLFEPRYRRLLADVQDGDRRFGIVCGLKGVDERDLPAGRTGCVAEVLDIEMLPDGRSNILVIGRERFALAGFVDDAAPYHVAEVDYVDDVPGESPVALAVAADDVAARFRRVVAAVRTLSGESDPPPAVPDEPAALAFAIGAMIDLDLSQRQMLLTERSAAARLTQIDAVLRRVLPDLELRAALKAES